MDERPSHLDLFSGIGGFSLAAEWAGFRTIAFVEKDPFCQKILDQHWPGVPIYGDIHQFGGRSLRPVSLLTGGFPCQPFSVAGEQRGKADDRYLWPEMLRVIQATNPDWVIGENVAGLDGLGLDDCVSDLEASGYEVAPPFEIPACAVDAKHRRNRIWIVANAVRQQNQWNHPRRFLDEPSRNGEVMADANKSRLQRQVSGELQECSSERAALESNPRSAESSPWPIEPDVGRVANGIPNRTHRLKGLGNAIVPQVAYQIIKAIHQTMRQKNE